MPVKVGRKFKNALLSEMQGLGSRVRQYYLKSISNKSIFRIVLYKFSFAIFSAYCKILLSQLPKKQNG